MKLPLANTPSQTQPPAKEGLPEACVSQSVLMMSLTYCFVVVFKSSSVVFLSVAVTSQLLISLCAPIFKERKT